MGIANLIVFLIMGALAGWIAGQLKEGAGFGLVGNIIVGVIGAFVGGFVFSLVGLTSTNLIGSFITAVIGAVIFLALIDYLKSR